MIIDPCVPFDVYHGEKQLIKIERESLPEEKAHYLLTYSYMNHFPYYGFFFFLKIASLFTPHISLDYYFGTHTHWIIALKIRF